MGGCRAIKAAAAATLAGALASGCATGGTQAGPNSRLEWLAAELAAEVDGLSAADPRAQAAALDLHAIAAFADGVTVADSEVIRWQWPLPVWSLELNALADVGSVFLEPLGPLPAMTLAATPAPQAALALGRFTDAQMARVMWREIESLDSAALTGLQAYLAVSDGGVMLLVGPVHDEAAAAERCLALTVWGLSCVPADWSAAAQPLAQEPARSGV
jgi:hypothetical protein